MRKPNWLLALMAGVLAMALLPIDDAAAQDLDVDHKRRTLYRAGA
jgi:hypothetical protein